MKVSSFAYWALLAVAASASPTPTVEQGHSLNKRAAINDACNIGYCTQNGGYVAMTLLLEFLLTIPLEPRAVLVALQRL